MDIKEAVRVLDPEWRLANGPLYLRLATALREAIRRGDIGPPARVPSERDLARSLGVSRTTVVSAYALLREEGFLESVRGSGTRVSRDAAGRVPAVRPPSLRFLGDTTEDIIDCAAASVAEIDGVADDDLGVAAEDVRRLVADYVYEPLGIPLLRHAVAGRYTQLGLPTGADEVLITTGAQQAVALLFSLFGRDRGTLIMENPTYVGALDAARSAEATVIGVATEEGGARLADVADKLKRFPVQAVYVMSTCQNPTGAVMNEAWRREIVELAAASDTPIFDDMTLSDLRFAAEPPRFLASFGRGTVVTIGSLSKLYWPGLRVGWVRGPAPLITRLAKLKMISDLGSSHFSQLLAASLVDETDSFAAVRRAQLEDRLALFSHLLESELPDWRFTHPRGGPFLWVTLPHGDGEVFARSALQHGVQVLPGAKMSPDDSMTDRLRISYVAPPEQLRIAATRLRRAWEDFGGEGAEPPPLDVVV